MSDLVFRIATATLSLLAVLELIPYFKPWLPMGGSNATQMAIVLGLGVFCAEVISIWGNF
ncbi:hypothetical protein Rleg10DRAFT_5823 [Rhizobium leguminosarum bv. trifolii WSM2012]|nr:hypothetical protein Rleg10DRAFT_4162 [Rhizobium leguminosarum bv. trifolii WSM2012]EJC75543.1 hypothetical protein Rleg10DRAFT_4163 [Rhizobium leguminosarum bv. trifolii WSM2012]EJC77129.1 hypothetical protein Rleg10DRAFT_5823 [Rhizobium leguminosarum bv. trifolii WSM2012]